MQRNYSWLEIAEYLSIVASMIGSIAAVATQKAALMAAPMSMSLMLNLLHRRKLLHFSRRKIGVEVTKQCEELSDLVVSLKSSGLEGIPTKEQLKQAIAALPLEQIETCLLRLCQKVEDQQVEITQLMSALQKFSNDLPSDITTLPQDLETIKDRVDRLDASQENLLDEEISSIKTELLRVSEKLAKLHQDPENIVGKKNLNRIVSAIKFLRQENLELRGSIAQLNEAVAKISAEGYPRQDLSRVATNESEEQFNNCCQQISDLRGSLAEVTRSIAILEKKFARQSEQIVPRSEIHSLISDLVTIEWQKSICLQPSTIDKFLSLDDFSPQPGEVKGSDNGFSKSFDLDRIPQLHREIKNLAEEIFTLESQMENRLAPLEAIDRHGFDEDLSLQAQAIAQLEEKTNKLLKSDEGNDRETAEMSSKIDRLEILLDRLSTQVQDLQRKVLSRVNSEAKLTGKCLHTFTAHREAVFCLDFSPDGNLLATGSADHTVKVWQVSQEILPDNAVALCETFSSHSHLVRAIAIGPQGDFIVSGSADRTMKIWPLNVTETRQPLTTLTGHTLSVRAIAISPDGNYLASGSGDQTIQIWSFRQNWGDRCDPVSDPEAILSGHTAPVDAIAFSPDSQLLASGGVDGSIKIWQIDAETLLHTIADHAEPISALAFSPDSELFTGDRPGYLLASGSVDCSIKIWHIRPKAEATTVFSTLTGHSEPVTCVKFSPDGHLLASASIDQTIKLWQISPLDGTASLLCTLTGHLEPVVDLAFRGDRTLASCSADGQVKLWACV